jgi:hypothetical protein
MSLYHRKIALTAVSMILIGITPHTSHAHPACSAVSTAASTSANPSVTALLGKAEHAYASGVSLTADISYQGHGAAAKSAKVQLMRPNFANIDIVNAEGRHRRIVSDGASRWDYVSDAADYHRNPVDALGSSIDQDNDAYGAFFHIEAWLKSQLGGRDLAEVALLSKETIDGASYEVLSWNITQKIDAKTTQISERKLYFGSDNLIHRFTKKTTSLDASGVKTAVTEEREDFSNIQTAVIIQPESFAFLPPPVLGNLRLPANNSIRLQH